VEFQCGVEVGGALSLDELDKKFDAVFIGVGLGLMEPLGIPGEDTPGVVDALRFIADYKTTQSIPVGRRVAVVGAGNTAIDAANAAKRLGAERVYMVYRRSEAEMPAFRFEYNHARLEGIEFVWQSAPVAVQPAADGRVGSLVCVRMQLGEPDQSGRRRPVPVPGTEFQIECDMVIPAIGQSRLLTLLEQCRGVALQGGSVVVDRATGSTANPRYFAGGDCVNGGREVVDAVADGKRAALGITRSVGVHNG
jgi:dihydropyrimidine dehydrogenase (NAD+) subunit PreT